MGLAVCETGLPIQNTKTGENTYTKVPQSIPNGHNIFPMAVK
jgi:hypothetical protein